jgi:outer membrane protein assembly factor BamB
MKAAGPDVIVSGLHSWQKEGRPVHRSGLYRFDGATGRVEWTIARWRHPVLPPISRNIAWFDVDNGLVAFGAYQWEPPAGSDAVPQSAVYLLDAKSGEPLASQEFRPLAPFFDTSPVWQAVAFDGEGGLAVGLMDGRAVLYRARGLEEVASLDLAPPVSVTGVPIYAGVGWAAGSDGTVYLLTDGRLIAPSASATGKTVHADHPSSNTLFAFDARTGKLLWRWKLTTTAQSVAAGGSLVAVSTQQSYSADDPMDYGVTVFDSGRPGGPLDKLQYRFHTAGPIVALAASPDGRTVAAVEAPVRLPDGLTVVGRYRLHIFH